MNGKKNLTSKQKLGIIVASVFGGFILLCGSCYGCLSCMNCMGWLTDETSSSGDSSISSIADTSSDSSNIRSDSLPSESENLSTPSSSDISQVEIPEPRETAIGKSDKVIDWFISPKATTVRNDVTGNWRYSGYSESGVDISEYALNYYQAYFKSNDEIHAVINFANKTTTRISYMGGMLFVTVLEYVDGEEHDAKLMFSGDVLQDFIVYTDNGDIELIDNPTPNSTSTFVSSSSSSQQPIDPSEPTSEQSNSSAQKNHFSDYSTPEQQNTTKCVLNTSTKKYHYPSCPDVKKIKPQNYSTIESEAAARALGYTACKRCH